MEEYKKYRIVRMAKDMNECTDDLVMVEYSMSIYINNHYFVTLLCTPASLKALVIGYLMSEGIIEQREDIKALKIDTENGKAFITLDSDDIFDFNGDQIVRERTITTGCGKGRTVAFPVIEKQMRIKEPLAIKHDKVIHLMKLFGKQSNLFKLTGGVHSCALCTYEDIVYFADDIGRHNALDKIIGKALINNDDFHDKIVLTTGRLSSEIINKAVVRGISMVVSRSAPTDNAIEMAKRINMILIGFVRGNRMNIYSGGERINESSC